MQKSLINLIPIRLWLEIFVCCEKTDLDSSSARYSTNDACEAARIFARIKFVGMSKKHVLWVLGPQETINDYNSKAKTELDSPLNYFFGSGKSGAKYSIEFTKGKVSKIEIISVN